MKRTLLQVYVRDATDAIALYTRAFDAKLLEIHHTDEGKVLHSEIDVYGQVLAVADREEEDGQADETGNIMQFCLQFGQEQEAQVRQAYEALQEGAVIRVPLGPCMFSPCMVDMIDRFGVRWCLFTA